MQPQKRRIFILILLLLTGGRSACATDSTNADGTDSAGQQDSSSADINAEIDEIHLIPVEEFCDRYVQGICLHEFRCVWTSGGGCTDPNTEDRFRTQCESSVRSAQQGRTRYDEQQAALCIRTLEEHCATMSNPFDYNPCRGVFAGLVELGGWCYPSNKIHTDECATGFCLREDEGCPGVCTEFLPQGADCSQSDFACGPGAACVHCDTDDIDCHHTTDTETCMATPKAGESCANHRYCTPGLVCRDDRCREVAPEDGACSDEVACLAHQVCIDGSCRSSVDTGDPCEYDFQCPLSHQCRVDCKPRIGLDQPCRLAYDTPDCQEGLVCLRAPGESGLCRPPGETGDDCYDGTCVDSVYCDDSGRCMARASLGSPCTENRQCTMGAFCMDDGNCHEPGALGDPCNRAWEHGTCQAGLYCAEGSLCRERAALGDDCTETSGCEFGLWCQNTCVVSPLRSCEGP